MTNSLSATMRIIGRYAVTDVESPHGIALDGSGRLAFLVGEENHMLAVTDLTTMKVLATHPVGEDPDVLAFDPGLKRLYVSAESGSVSVFREDGKTLSMKGTSQSPHVIPERSAGHPPLPEKG
jgi:DNA-binding beta-propeller fold protein YncE